MALTINPETNRFESHGKPTGIVAKRTPRGRWQYRDAATGTLYASGMTPAAFAKSFWFRDDFTEDA